MNKVILMGRLTKDPELRLTANDHAVANFQIAVDRRFKNAHGEREADFIPIVCWRQTAEFVSQYFKKGQRIALVGSIQVRHWDDENGQRRYMTEVIADEVYFADSKNALGGQRQNAPRQPRSDNQEQSFEGKGFFAGTDDTELPFDL